MRKSFLLCLYRDTFRMSLNRSGGSKASKSNARNLLAAASLFTAASAVSAQGNRAPDAPDAHVDALVQTVQVRADKNLQPPAAKAVREASADSSRLSAPVTETAYTTGNGPSADAFSLYLTGGQ